MTTLAEIARHITHAREEFERSMDGLNKVMRAAGDGFRRFGATYAAKYAGEPCGTCWGPDGRCRRCGRIYDPESLPDERRIDI